MGTLFKHTNLNIMAPQSYKYNWTPAKEARAICQNLPVPHKIEHDLLDD